MKHSSQFFRKDATKSGVLGRNNHKKGQQNPGGTDKHV